MKIIQKIRIRSFRSVLDTTRGSSTTIDCKELNIIVGNNDAGKSNYLRALNLFFNNETNPNTSLDFWKDYSYQRHGVRREENRIEIELIISPPKKQSFKHNGDIKWTKIWKVGSLLPLETIVYINPDKNGNIPKFTGNRRSSYYKWLKKIKFKYVPAIKSKEYFDNLLFNLYDVLQKDTKTLEDDFNKQVLAKTSQISQELKRRLNIESTLQFKGSFRDLFNTMEFGSKDGKYMLEQRGDGIKIRHIPIILQNIAEAELKETKKQEPIANTIWGFEEPENNLEFTSAYALAQNFIDYISQIHFQDENCAKYDEGIQIFLTTHSPIFYTLGNNNNERIQSFFVDKGDKDKSVIRVIDKKTKIDIEEKMKLLPLFEMSKSWKKIIEDRKKVEKVEKVEKELKEKAQTLDELGANKKCFFLTEDENIDNLKSFLEIHEFNLDETEIISYYGVSNINSASTVLGKHLKKKFPNAKIILHRDRDYVSDDEINREKDKIEKKGITYFVTTGTDIESHFINIDYFEAIFKIPRTDLKDIIEQSTNELEDASLERFHTEYFIKNSIEAKEIRKKTKELVTKYQNDKERYRYGKKVFKKIKSKIQAKLKRTPTMIQKNQYIINQELQNFSDSIWNK